MVLGMGSGLGKKRHKQNQSYSVKNDAALSSILKSIKQVSSNNTHTHTHTHWVTRGCCVLLHAMSDEPVIYTCTCTCNYTVPYSIVGYCVTTCIHVYV